VTRTLYIEEDRKEGKVWQNWNKREMRVGKKSWKFLMKIQEEEVGLKDEKVEAGLEDEGS
jgi:hypothetical protein